MSRVVRKGAAQSAAFTRPTAPHALAALAGFSLLLAGCGDGPPRAIEVTAPPGAIALIPFEGSTKNKRTRALSYIPATPRTDPTPLPQRALLIYHGLGLFGSGAVSGNLLVKVPDDATGEIQFSVSAYGQARSATGGGASFFSTDDVAVTISVEGERKESSPLNLAGVWEGDDQSWSFRTGSSPVLTIRYSDGDEKTIRYSLHADGRGRWILLETGIEPAVYWIEIDDVDVLHVSHPGEAFDPFARYSRAQAD